MIIGTSCPISCLDQRARWTLACATLSHLLMPDWHLHHIRPKRRKTSNSKLMENLGPLPNIKRDTISIQTPSKSPAKTYTTHKLDQVMSQRTHIGARRELASTIPSTACTELRTFKDPMVGDGPISAHAVSRPPPIFTYLVPLFYA